MTDLLVEAVLLAFCVGGAFGAVVTLHLQYYYRARQNSHGEDQLPMLQKAHAHVEPRRSQK